jgi:heme/copper-type cytochrome/quinol oxidase subunit 3
MSAVEVKTVPAKALSTTATGSRSLGWWGMVLFILTESALFASLIFSYFYITNGNTHLASRGHQPPRATPAHHHDCYPADQQRAHVLG